MDHETTVLSQGWDGPFYRVRTDAFEARFLSSTEEDLDEAANVDVEVRLPDGSRWSATIFTLAEVDRLMGRWETTGECLAGRYFWVSDGLIVREPGVAKMTEVLVGLHRDGHLTEVMCRLDDEPT